MMKDIFDVAGTQQEISRLVTAFLIINGANVISFAIHAKDSEHVCVTICYEKKQVQRR